MLEASHSDAVQKLHGDGLILVANEAECQEVDADLLAVPVPQRGDETMFALKKLSVKN